MSTHLVTVAGKPLLLGLLIFFHAAGSHTQAYWEKESLL